MPKILKKMAKLQIEKTSNALNINNELTSKAQDAMPRRHKDPDCQFPLIAEGGFVLRVRRRHRRRVESKRGEREGEKRVRRRLRPRHQVNQATTSMISPRCVYTIRLEYKSGFCTTQYFMKKICHSLKFFDQKIIITICQVRNAPKVPKVEMSLPRRCPMQWPDLGRARTHTWRHRV